MSAALRRLLASSIDYAGLFPPAALGMEEAVRAYDEYRRGPHAWALGRFIVPVARLGDFESATQGVTAADPWRLAALAGADFQSDVSKVLDFNRRHVAEQGGFPAVIEAIEVKADRPEDVRRLGSSLPDGVEAFVELPADRDPKAAVAEIKAVGVRAKVRTGGVTAEAFPTAEQLARFIRCCVAHNVPFKATAGLHHPLRAEYPVTYEPGSPRATMFGFLNVFIATALARGGASDAEIVAVLQEQAASAFRFDDESISWRDRRVPLADVQATRQRAVRGFGSCSFVEPIDELTALGLL